MPQNKAVRIILGRSPLVRAAASAALANYIGNHYCVGAERRRLENPFIYLKKSVNNLFSCLSSDSFTRNCHDLRKILKHWSKRLLLPLAAVFLRLFLLYLLDI